MSLFKACRRGATLRSFSRPSFFNKHNKNFPAIYPYAHLQHANFAPPAHHPPPPSSRHRRPFFRRVTRKLLGAGVLISAFCYFMDADFPTYFYDLYRAKYDQYGMTDKTIWVVGASSGIGEYLVYQLAKSGAKRIIISSRRKDQLKRVKQECEQLISNINAQNHKTKTPTISKETLERRVNEEIDKLPDDKERFR